MTSLLSTTKALWSNSTKMQELHANENRGTVTSVPFEPVTLAVVGCGQRGKAYTRYALSCPEQCKVVAIAEPRPNTQRAFAAEHSVDDTLVFRTWRDLHAASAETLKTIGKRLADAVIVSVQDEMHAEVVKAFAEQGYHILCEKPMATSIEDCIKMEAAVAKAGIIFGMGHVMRYSAYHQEIGELVKAGTLGRLINVVQIEPVGHYHFAHSYVRGNWRSEKTSSFSLMTKSCHDIDIIRHWFTPSEPVRISSFGSLQHFRKEAKPPAAGNALRCLDCPIENDCSYSAKRIYLDRVSRGERGWPVSPLIDGVADIENVTAALKDGPYGRCVYECDNDVCDNQVVNLEFADGRTASFTMVAFTSLICDRQLRMHFTHGEIVGDMNKYTVTDFRLGKSKTYYPKNEGGGHGGGDLGLIRAFVEAVRTGKQDILGTNVTDVLRSHLTVFAAEMSRREGSVINFTDFEKEQRRGASEETSNTARHETT